MDQTTIQRQLVEATQAFQSYRTRVDRALVSAGYAPIFSGSKEVDIVRRYWRMAADASQAATHIKLARDIR